MRKTKATVGSMDIIFEDSALEDLFRYGTTDDKRYRKQAKDKKFVRAYITQINYIKAANTVNDLFNISPLHYERLRTNYSGLSSFRINNRYVERVLCREHENKIQITLIEIDNTHYGNKH